MDRSGKAVGAPIYFGTKAETLERLAAVVTRARVLPQVRFTVSEWEAAPERVLSRLGREEWRHDRLIVRSSAVVEDGASESHAGEFLSVAGVSGDTALREAVERVIASFGRGAGDNQVFIQPMLAGVAVSGVAFSIDPNNLAPYFVINYDDVSGATDTVTSGTADRLRTFYCYRFADVQVPSPLAGIIALVRELEELLQNPAIDVEFALAGDGILYLLQVRPLPVREHSRIEPERHRAAVTLVERKVAELMSPHPYLHGARTVFGVMPDWNPAEIIGVRPRPLALSLYKDLVTDNIWAYQRDNYGYKNLRSFPLMVSFCGMPFIDVRVSFNSFIPADVEAGLADKLANYYITKLLDAPSFHDKVEFEIIFSCYTLDLPERIGVLAGAGFTRQEIDGLEASLRQLTNGIIHGQRGLWRKDIARIHELEGRRDQILGSGLDKISKLYWLIEDCKRYGTLPFAGLARAGFIAVQLLKSLVSVGILTAEDYHRFMASLETVSSRMTRDFNQLGRSAFLERYGHLRPGTYDILSPRYDEAPDLYFDWSRQAQEPYRPPERFTLSLEQLRRTQESLDAHGLEHDVLGLFEFIKGAIEGREFAKFIFTRSLSDVLTLFGQLGAEHGLTAQECAFADIKCIATLYSSSADVGQVLLNSVREGQASHDITCSINLPPLVTAPDDVWSFHLPRSEPNFITLGRATGPVIGADADRTQLRDAILMIPSADPGYDWIFSQGIAGFVTMYGGVNSHMAIRAGELNIPAVIGAGEGYYGDWSRARVLEVDCANRQVRVLR